MSYPLIIKDNFFSDPDAIANIIKHVDYSVLSNNYPGVRSKPLHEIIPKLYGHIMQKIFHLFHDEIPQFNAKVEFQKIRPFVEGDKWHRKNLGWIHTDNCLFGGVIYLDRDPDKDAGTSIYKSIDGYDLQTYESILVKEELYGGNEIDDMTYNKAYDIVREQYEETLRIPPIYNRMVLIPGNQSHAMTTTGDKERNTLVFFCFDVLGIVAPEYKQQSSTIPNHALYA